MALPPHKMDCVAHSLPPYSSQLGMNVLHLQEFLSLLRLQKVREIAIIVLEELHPQCSTTMEGFLL